MGIQKIKILAISGSLKSSSSNLTILREFKSMAGIHVDFNIYEGLETLPQFNPDKENGNEAVNQLRTLLKAAQGVIISTPEYAFGVPGALKNALDWTVSSGELNEKPLLVISASPLYEGGAKALAALLLTLSALGAQINQQSSLAIADISNKIRDGRIVDEATKQDLNRLFDHLMLSVDPLYIRHVEAKD